MKLRRAFGYAALGLGATALANRAFATAAGDLGPALDGDQGSYRWRGIDVAYAEAGDPDDPTVVFLHGINAAGSSGEFREVFGPLADEYHVVAPDLPGFGRSDRPPLRYSASLYEDFVRDFVSEFDEPAVVATSLTAAYTVAVAGDLEVSRLVLICPTAEAMPWTRTWVRELVRLPLVGTALFNLATSKASIRRNNADHGYYDPSAVSAEWTDYQWQTTHQPGARFAPASFFGGFLNESDLDLGAAIAALDVPVTLFWGRETETTPLSEGRAMADRGDARLTVFDDALLQPHVEHGDEAVAELRAELSG
jgi:pimeloyl-ACP methyl ester carboxylesterase